MPDDHSRLTDRLQPNRTFFHAALVFLILGIAADMLQVKHQVWQINVALLAGTALVYAAIFLLDLRGRLGHGQAVLLALVVTVLVFTAGVLAGSMWAPDHPRAWVANPQVILLYCLFGTVCGIAVDKRAGMAFAACAVAIEIWYAAGFRNSFFYREQLPLNIFVISGAAIMVWHYRSRLEELVFRLDDSLGTLRGLKERAERINEQNRPFVTFGRNTAGLVADFAAEADRLTRELDTLRRLAACGNGTGDAPEVLGRMTEAVSALNQRIEWVKYVASATPERRVEEIELRQLVESALYTVRILPECRDNVSFRLDGLDGIRFRGLRHPILQQVLGLVSAGCAAGATLVSIGTRTAEDGAVFLAYRDNAGREASVPLGACIGGAALAGSP